MKGKKHLCKKALSLFLTVVMLMTCWVFFAPTKADAATAGSYYVKITWVVTNRKGDALFEGANFDNNYTGISSVSTSSNSNNRAGMSLFFKENNGTSTTEKEAYWDLGKGNGTYGGTGMDTGGHLSDSDNSTHYATATITGFPTRLFGMADGESAAGSVAYKVTKIEIGASSTSTLTTIWSGTAYVSTTMNCYYFNLYPTTEGGNDSSYGYANTDTPRVWNSPVATTITGLANTTLTIDKTSGSVTSSVLTGVVKDQYGVNWYQAPTYSLTNASGTAVTNPSRATSGDGVKLTATTACLTTANGYTTASGTAAFTLKATCGSASQSVTITVKSPTYYVYFYDGDGNQISYKTCYYNGSVTAPTSATKSPDATYHYQFKGTWDKSYTTVTSDVATNAQFDAIAHTFQYANNNDGTHHVSCTGCSYTADEAHDYAVTTVNAQCEIDGSKNYKCT
ncbi:MAG: hypothetical protein ACI4SB_05850, partial [Acutalibacteraceae bacterium]